MSAQRKKKEKKQTSNIDWIRIGLAPPEEIMRWSKRKGPGGTEYYAEVKKPETFNYRTYKPEKDGLFCERIFGPAEDYECACGKYKKVRFRGVVCERCGVMVTRSRVRREWMGHIKLAAPVSHIWFTKSIPNRMSYLLGINAKEIEKIVYYVQYIVTKIDIEWLLDSYRDIEDRVEEHIRELKAQKFNLSDKREIRLFEKLERFTTDDDDKRETSHSLAEKYGDGETLHQGQDFSEDEDIAEDLDDLKDFVNSEKLLQEARLAERLIDPGTNEVIGEVGDEFSYALLSKLFDAGFYNFTVESKQAQLENEKKLEELDYTISRLDGGLRLLKKLKKWERVPDNDTVTSDGNVATPGYESFSVLRHFLYRYHEIDLDEHIQLKMGAEALDDIFSSMDLQEMEDDLEYKKDIATTKQRRRKLTKRLRVIRAFKQSGNRPEWMILKVLPVLPPDLRPMVELDGGRFASSDLNDLYRRVINRNNRLKKLMEIRAPASILRNEKRMLQEAVDSLIDNGRKGKPAKNTNNRALKSLADMLKGKQGRFRQNLLGKRVDYSGRSVIVSGPHLKLHQCGLPKHMALELFKPFVLNKLIEPDNPKQNISEARMMLEEAEDEKVWDALDDIIKNHPVLLNRAPTLHRLSIQAFEPVLTESTAIEIHPLVCPPYNADFDGDAMAVHVPLSTAAKAEARTLMLSSNNLLLPADGKPITTPSQDMVLGSYYITQVRPGEYTEPIPEKEGATEERLKRFTEYDLEDEDTREKLGELPTFRDTEEVIVAYENEHIGLQQPILLPLDWDISYAVKEEPEQERFTTTTVGRVLFNQRISDLYREVGVPEENELPFYNFPIAKRDLADILEEAYRYCGQEFTALLCDTMKEMGFEMATQAGVTLAVSDICVPSDKSEILERAEDDANEVWEKYNRDILTENEKNEEVIKIWDNATKDLTKAMKQNFDVLNPIWMMAESGARGKVDQVKQLSALRGLMVGPTGNVLDFPIKSNFREGLSVYEYFVSTHGSRKGLVDTALKTADSGYLTRRLVDVALDVHIAEQDCGVDRGIEVDLEKRGGFEEQRVKKELFGRLLASDFVHPETGEVVYERDTEMDHAACEHIYEILSHDKHVGNRTLEIRSPLTCETLSTGVCAKCYGWDLSRWGMAEVGDPVGVVAAQSIGEPGTQLTMRTFHTGGAASTRERVTEHKSDASGSIKQIKELDEEEAGAGSLEIRLESGEGEERVIRTPPTSPEVSVEVLVEEGKDIESGDVIYKKKEREHIDITQGLPYVESLLEVRNAKSPSPLTEFEGTVDDITKVTPWVAVVRDVKANLERTYTIECFDDRRPPIDMGDKISRGQELDHQGNVESEIGGEIIKLYPEDRDSYHRVTVAEGSELELEEDGPSRASTPIEVTADGNPEALAEQLADAVDEHVADSPAAERLRDDLLELLEENEDGEIDFEPAEESGLSFRISVEGYELKGDELDAERVEITEEKDLAELSEFSPGSLYRDGVRNYVIASVELSAELDHEAYLNDFAGQVSSFVTTEEQFFTLHSSAEREGLLEALASGEELETEDDDVGRNFKTWTQVEQQRPELIEFIEELEIDRDDWDGLTTNKDPLASVRRRKNKALRRYHPDKSDSPDEEKAKRVSNAYEELKNNSDYLRDVGATELTVPDTSELETEHEAALVTADYDEKHVGGETETYETPPENRALLVSEGDKVGKAQMLCEGGSDLKFDLEEYHELMGDLETQRWLVEEVQGVYESQGVSVDTKHIEIIADRMFAYAEVDDPGDFEGEVYRGDKIEKSLYRILSNHADESDEELEKPDIRTLIQGISKASLSTDSWLAAASFQETTRVLTENSIKGKRDYLRGLKENVIIGGLIPVGTGRKRDILYQIDRQRRVESVFDEDGEAEEAEAEEVEAESTDGEAVEQKPAEAEAVGAEG